VPLLIEVILKRLRSTVTCNARRVKKIRRACACRIRLLTREVQTPVRGVGFPAAPHRTWPDVGRSRRLENARGGRPSALDFHRVRRTNDARMPTSTEVIIWEPVGFGVSSFGHASVVIRDGREETSYSLAPKGCDIQPFSEYRAKQHFRDGHGLMLRLSEAQAQAVARHFEWSISCEYTFLAWTPEQTNNCTTPIQIALRRAGIHLKGISIMPRALGLNLWNNGLVASVTHYKGDQAVQGVFHAPWTPPSGAYPWARRR
jgi:hypothetical protein